MRVWKYKRVQLSGDITYYMWVKSKLYGRNTWHNVGHSSMVSHSYFSLNISPKPQFIIIFSSFLAHSSQVLFPSPFPSPPFLLTQTHKPLVPSCSFTIYMILKLVCCFLNHIRARSLLFRPYQASSEEEKERVQVWSYDSKEVLELMDTRFEAPLSLEVRQLRKS